MKLFFFNDFLFNKFIKLLFFIGKYSYFFYNIYDYETHFYNG